MPHERVFKKIKGEEGSELKRSNIGNTGTNRAFFIEDELKATPDQLEVLRLRGEGKSNREIADLLGISLGAVKRRIERLKYANEEGENKPLPTTALLAVRAKNSGVLSEAAIKELRRKSKEKED